MHILIIINNGYIIIYKVAVLKCLEFVGEDCGKTPNTKPLMVNITRWHYAIVDYIRRVIYYIRNMYRNNTVML